MGKKNITILSVSFNSSIHLKRLIENFLLKSSQLENIKFLIVDNTNGDDKALYTAFDELYDVRIIKNNNRFNSDLTSVLIINTSTIGKCKIPYVCNKFL